MDPRSPAPYCVVGSQVFESVETMQATFGRQIAEFAADVPNFTNIELQLQISELVIS